MDNLDTQIGQNVVRLRGATSQKEIANQMRDRGWKWSQATVWSVEKGERSLRLAEAGDLATILRCWVSDLMVAEDQARLRRAEQRADTFKTRFLMDYTEYMAALSELARAADARSVLTEEERRHYRELITLTPELMIRATGADWRTDFLSSAQDLSKPLDTNTAGEFERLWVQAARADG
jgi:hypothetical protein